MTGTIGTRSEEPAVWPLSERAALLCYLLRDLFFRVEVTTATRTRGSVNCTLGAASRDFRENAVLPVPGERVGSTRLRHERGKRVSVSQRQCE